jgi:hypothetical protein
LVRRARTATSPIVILYCTLLSLLLCLLTPHSSQCRRTMSPSRSSLRVPPSARTLDQRTTAELFHTCASPSHRARLLSLKCRHAGTYLDTVPVNPYLRLSYDERLHQRLPFPPWRYWYQPTCPHHDLFFVGVTSRAENIVGGTLPQHESVSMLLFVAWSTEWK